MIFNINNVVLFFIKFVEKVINLINKKSINLFIIFSIGDKYFFIYLYVLLYLLLFIR